MQELYMDAKTRIANWLNSDWSSPNERVVGRGSQWYLCAMLFIIWLYCQLWKGIFWTYALHHIAFVNPSKIIIFINLVVSEDRHLHNDDQYLHTDKLIPNMENGLQTYHDTVFMTIYTVFNRHKPAAMNKASQSELPENDPELVFPVLPLVLLLSFLALGALIGNSLVCLAIYVRPALHKTTYLAVASLAVADLLSGLTAMPAYILKKALSDPSPLVEELICDVFRFSYFLTGYASILNLCVISMERLLAIRKPLTYDVVVTMKRLSVVLLLAWADAILISSLPFIRWTDEEAECAYDPRRWWSMMVIVTNVFIPFLFITVCYAYMYRIARRHLRRIQCEMKGRQNICHSQPDRKASKTVAIVIGIFVITWFPSCFYYFLKLVCPPCFPKSFDRLEGIFNTLVKLLTFSGSFLNPIIYCWRSRDFRGAFVHILTGRLLRRCWRKSAGGNPSLSYSLRSTVSVGRQRPSDEKDDACWASEQVYSTIQRTVWKRAVCLYYRTWHY